jgi:hypothetical protein
VNVWVRVAVGAGAAGAAILAGCGVWTTMARWRRQDPAEGERQWRLSVNRAGRITSGQVVDVIETPAAGQPRCLVVYRYEIGGVLYEASQDVASLPGLAAAARRSVGQIISVKYVPKDPASSIVACEDWTGLREPARLAQNAMLSPEESA